MPTIDEIRRANLNALIKAAGGNKAFADQLGASESQVSQWANGSANSSTGTPRGMRTTTAQRIEDVAKKPRGWLDQVHDDVQDTGSAPAGGITSTPAPPTFAEALQVVTTTLTALGGVRRTMARSALHEAIDHPEMLDDTAAQIEEWLATESTSSKRTGTR